MDTYTHTDETYTRVIIITRSAWVEYILGMGDFWGDFC